MGWQDKMSNEDREYLVSIGIINDKSPKPSGYKLVWRFGGRDELLSPQKMPYNYCVTIRKKKEKEPQYRAGRFIILPIFK